MIYDRLGVVLPDDATAAALNLRRVRHEDTEETSGVFFTLNKVTQKPSTAVACDIVHKMLKNGVFFLKKVPQKPSTHPVCWRGINEATYIHTSRGAVQGS